MKCVGSAWPWENWDNLFVTNFNSSIPTNLAKKRDGMESLTLRCCKEGKEKRKKRTRRGEKPGEMKQGQGCEIRQGNSKMPEQEGHETLQSQQESREVVFACHISWTLIPAPPLGPEGSRTAGDVSPVGMATQQPRGCSPQLPGIPSSPGTAAHWYHRTNGDRSTRPTHLGLRVQVCGISGNAELHRPRFHGNHSYRYSSQPANR